LFHVDGKTDTTKLTVAFRNFANEPKKLVLTGFEQITVTISASVRFSA